MQLQALSYASLAQIRSDIDSHRLPHDFLNTVIQYYWPLASRIRENHTSGKTRLIGVQGLQGSGKSTCAAFLKTLLETEFELKVLVASLDDFYLSLSERRKLADTIHPLLVTRGVPGTHDLDLIHQLISNASSDKEFTVSSFNKASDDRAPSADWPNYQGPFDIVILEGWCVGVRAQTEESLMQAINDLERSEDPNLRWRRFVNRALAHDYQRVFDQLDMLISLQAPNFECVYQWRLLQEQKLIEKLSAAGKSVDATMNPTQIQRFISHYQRLSEHALNTLPAHADAVLLLNKNHGFNSIVL